MSSFFRVLLLGASLGLTLVACSEAKEDDAAPDDVSSISKSIGAAGGTVEVTGVKLVIPPGSLSETVEIRIERSHDSADGPFAPYSAAFVFEPQGQTFAIPATLTMDYSRFSADPTIWWGETLIGPWENLNASMTGNAVQAQITHFSVGVVGSQEMVDRDTGNDVFDPFEDIDEDPEDDIEDDTSDDVDEEPNEGCTDCGPAIVVLSAGNNHTCAINEEGTLWCWGANDQGQTTGAWPTSASPRMIGEDSEWATVDAGNDFTCAIDVNGGLWCWGANDFGQLGNTDEPRFTEAQAVGEAQNWRSVSAGVDTACAINADDELWCWGSNNFGVAGIDSGASIVEPSQVQGSWKNVSVGNYHACGVQTDASLWCWGGNQSGRIGLPTSTSQMDLPSRVGEANDWVIAIANGYSSCAIREDGDALCWGNNQGGQLGDGTSISRHELADFGVDGPWVQIALGPTSRPASVGVKDDGSLWSWGTGPLGRGTLVEAAESPSPVVGTSNFSLVTAGARHLCAANNKGAIFCWGENESGQLGLGNDELNLQPTFVDFEAPCTAASDEEICDLYGAECGELQAVDNCGNERTVECGGCANGECGECIAGPCPEPHENLCPCVEDGESGELICG